MSESYDGFFINEPLDVESAVDRDFGERFLHTSVYDELDVWGWAHERGLDNSFADDFKCDVDEEPVRSLVWDSFYSFFRDGFLDGVLICLMVAVVAAVVIGGNSL